ncbi:hypothetical protein KA021_01955 [Candidatus Saccharibacteria bacterium]|jgi:hypothetical protein|nr:hypothetical protein [Candidatus Saccharibacteria bacterium]
MKKPQTGKNEEMPQIVLRVTIVLAIVGSLILLVTRKDTGPSLAFDLLAYVISIMAVVLTTLQSIAIARQVRLTRHSAAKVTEAVNKLEELVVTDKKLTKIILKDSELDAQIVLALANYGVGKSAQEREKIAKFVSKKIR